MPSGHTPWSLFTAPLSGGSRALARRRQRKLHRERCIPDPNRPGKRINPEPDCPHGTVSGHDNWSCQCMILVLIDEVGNPGGCEPAAVAAARASRLRRRLACD